MVNSWTSYGDEITLSFRQGIELQPNHGSSSVTRLSLDQPSDKDITGRLPRVVERFEARQPRDKAAITEVDGTVLTDRWSRVCAASPRRTNERATSLGARSVHGNVQERERVRAGDPLHAMFVAVRPVRSTARCRGRPQQQ
jgi:hypothetical protein